MRTNWLDIVNCVATAVAAVAAGASWKASVNANKTSKAISRIEINRRKRELTPEFEINWEKPNDDIARLTIRLIGPTDIVLLDEISLSIRDNKKMDLGIPAPAMNSQGQPSREDINNQIWAPFRFDPGTLGVTSNGRSAGITDFSLGDQWIFQLAKTPPPLWTRNLPPNWWESLGIESRLGILITCRRSTSDEGKQEWEILKTIDHVN